MEIVLRATAIYWFLWLVVRGTGKRSLAELTPLDLIMVVVLGDFVQQGVTQEDMSVTGAMAAVSVFVLWTLGADLLARRNPRARALLNSHPDVIVRSGEPLMDRLSDENLSLAELLEAARLEGFASLEDVAFAVLETDGKISFIPFVDTQ